MLKKDNRPRDVVVTGIGAITPIGIGKDELWENALKGTSGAGIISQFDHRNFPVHFACEVKNFEPLNWIEAKKASRLDRYAQFALAASVLAVEDAGIKFQHIDKYRCGVLFGTGIGGQITNEVQCSQIKNIGPKGVAIHTIPALLPNAGAAQIAIQFGLKGLCYGTVSACASAAHALALALKHIQNGDADMIIAGGSEAAITELTAAGFAKLKAISLQNDDPQRASKPFDRDRDGFVLGEGSAAIILESREHAKQRGAKVYADFLGASMNCDAFSIIAPCEDTSSLIACMAGAINDAGLNSNHIEHINTHGTSTVLNDRLESQAIKQLFGEEKARMIAVNSTKSMTGHLLGAAGALEFALTALAAHYGVVPPTINYFNPDPECDLDYTPNQSRQVQIQYALSNSFGFGGHNCCLCIGKPQA
jgi:3-oxoacyl-[acyl-carrier-protein] synthase II